MGILMFWILVLVCAGAFLIQVVARGRPVARAGTLRLGLLVEPGATLDRGCRVPSSHDPGETRRRCRPGTRDVGIRSSALAIWPFAGSCVDRKDSGRGCLGLPW